MATTVFLEAKAKPGQVDELLALLREVLPDTRRYDGCLSLVTFRNQDEPETVLLVGEWESKGHYERYLSWREETGVFGRFAAILDGDPSLRFFDRTDI